MTNDRFSSSWRPLIGYICSAALFYNFVLSQIIYSICSVYNVHYAILTQDNDNLMQLTMIVLGMSGLRTYEKHKKINK